MPYDPHRHRRRSIRLPGYDYASAGAYFVTICAERRQCIFGEIIDGEVQPNEAGYAVATVWDDLSAHYPGVITPAFTLMPNHVHGIICLESGTTDTGTRGAGMGTRGAGTGTCPYDDPPPRLSLPDVVHRFKLLTTTRYRRGVYDRAGRPSTAGSDSATTTSASSAARRS